MAKPYFFVKLGISGLSPAKLIERTRALVIALSGNLSFPVPLPTLAVLTAAADALEAAEAAVLNNGGRQDYLARNERANDLRILIRLLGAYVQGTSGSDPEKILSAGFETRKPRTPIGLLPAPGNLRAIAAALPHMIILRWDRVRGRFIYQIWICSADPTVQENWSLLDSVGDNSYRVKGLTSHVPCSFRVLAIGAAGTGPLSDIASAMPL